MKTEYLFDILEDFPEEIDEKTITQGTAPPDCEKIKRLTHQRIADPPHPQVKKGRRVVVLLVAAVILVSALTIGTISVVGKDNYNYYSTESQKIKKSIDTEYQNKYEMYLDKLYAEELSAEEYSDYWIENDMVKTAQNIAVSDMYEIILNILKDKGYIDNSFTKKDIFYHRDDFIASCCNAFSTADLSAEDKTRIYMYLYSMLEEKQIFGDNSQIEFSAESKNKIKDTLKIYIEPDEHHTIDELMGLGKELNTYIDTELYQDQERIDSEYNRLYKIKLYRNTPEYIAFHGEVEHAQFTTDHYISTACSEYYKNTGVNLFKPETGEEYSSRRAIIAEAYGKTAADYVEKIDPIIKKIDPGLAGTIDAERVKTAPAYVADILQIVYDAVIDTNTELSVEERSILEVWFNTCNAFVNRSQDSYILGNPSTAKTDVLCQLIARKLAVDDNNVAIE